VRDQEGIRGGECLEVMDASYGKQFAARCEGVKVGMFEFSLQVQD
jgi:hypothetical protein